ncbi:MFS transporter [Mesobacillus harenae]|uniref:MFS transporter n=1 Tax=Mesobacillus harenae TaxID=2213203 RepID=UPI00157FC73B|nr:MFS transporter [Mesobacillus harenae]
MAVLLIGVMMTHLGIYLVLPILPILLKMDAGLSLVQIGSILAAISICFQFGSILGGFLADRIGRRFIIGLGALITGSGLIGFSFFTGFLHLLILAGIVGLGNGLNAPSTKAAIAAMAAKENQTTAFSLRGIAANVGTGTAGLIVFLFISGSTTLIFWVAGSIFYILTAISWIFLPKNCGNEPCPEIPKGAYGEAFRNKPFMMFGFISLFIWALYTQLSLMLPLRAADVLAVPENVALVWTINSLIVIAAQNQVSNRITRRLHPLTTLSIGLLFVGAGVASLFWASSFMHLALSGVIFVFGEMLILPTIDSTISQLSKANLIGLFFGLANVIAGLGEAGGRFLGSSLLEYGKETPYLPWLTFALAGVILSIVVLSLKKWRPLQNSLMESALQKNTPKHAPMAPVSPIREHPFDKWEPEVFFRKRKSPRQ